MLFARRGVLGLMAPALLLACAAMLPAALAAPAAAQTTFNRGNGPEPSSLDPHIGTDVQSSRIGYDLFEGLLTFAPDGKAIPGAAESWTISPDGLVYTFTLRADGRWSDGTPVTADDFVFAWRRLVDPATGSQYAYFLWPVKNGEAISAGKAPVDSLGVEAVDARTLRVTLEEPTGYFLSSLIHRITYPVSKASFEKLGKEAIRPGNLVSNGAYVLAEHVPQTSVRLTRNPHFREADSVKIDTVVYWHSDSPETEFRRFRAGELDVLNAAPVTQVEWIEQNMPETRVFHPALGTAYLILNMTKEPWKSNPQLRRALNLAIDRQAIVEKITRSGERPTFTFVPEGMIDGYRPPLPAEAAMTQAERDGLARKLLAEAGYGPGGKPLEIEIMHPTSESTRRIVVGIAAMWQSKLGAKVTLNNQEWKVVLQNAAEKSYTGAVPLIWIGDFPDPYTFLKILRGDVGRMNRSGYASAAFDRLMDEATALTDPEARAAKMAEAEAVMLADSPIIPIYNNTWRNVVSPRVKGWTVHPMGVQLSRYVTVER